MKSAVLAIACLLSLGGLGCMAEVADPEDQDVEVSEADEDAEVGEAEQAVGPCMAMCTGIFRGCLWQGTPPAVCKAKFDACVACEPYP